MRQSAVDLAEALVHFDGFLRPHDFPRIGTAQPVVGLLHLVAVLDLLPKHAVLIAQPVAHGGNLQGGQRIDEARRQAAEAAIAETGVRLHFRHFLKVQPFAIRDLLDEWF